jgi:RHS repeat-associated protein
VPDQVVKNGVAYRMISDVLGSVRLVVNASTGEVAQQLTYDAFGKVVADTSPGFQPFGFAGGLYDSDTGLVRFGARDYDAESARWTVRDPILFGGGQTNFYAYVNNDPVNMIDVLGLAINFDYCRRLLEKIRNITQKISQRIGELREDPQGLPEACPGDDEKPSLSRRGHRKLINKDKANLAVQKGLYLAFCGPPPGGFPQEEGNNVFDWEYWEEVTGLTGTALVIYLIISEGSRLYPPRNAVPVP